MARTHELEARITMKVVAQGAKEAKSETADLADELAKLAESFDRNVASQEIMRKELIKLEGAGERLSDEWRILNDDLDRAEAALLRQRGAILELNDAYQEKQTVTDQEKQAAKELVRQAEELVDVEKRENAEVQEGIELDKLKKRAMDQVTTSLIRQEEEQKDYIVAAKAKAQVDLEQAKNTERLRREGELFGLSLGDLKKSLISGIAIGGASGLVFKGLNLITDGFQRAKDAVVEFHKESQIAFAALEEEIARTSAQIPGMVANQEELFNTTTRFSREIARTPLDTAEALRKAQNLGLSYAEALDAVESSSISAKVGGSELTETLVAATGTVNAYGEGIYSVNEVLDQYAFITQNSNLETSDLVTGMAKIISPAAEAGVTLEEVAAAMVVMNRQGDDFNEISDLLGNALTQIAVRGTTASDAFVDAAGVGFREFTEAGGTLIEGLALIEEHADKTGLSISELVQGNSKFYRDMQAGRGILELTGRHAGELEEAYRGASNATGTLAEQNKEFAGTMYEANLELESAVANAQAVEGSLFKAGTVGWVEFKTQAVDTVADVSAALKGFLEVSELIGRPAEGGLGVLDGVRIAQKGVADNAETAAEANALYVDRLNIIRDILLENKDITAEELELQVDLVVEKGKQKEAALETREATEQERLQYEKLTMMQKERVDLQKQLTEQAKEQEEIEKRKEAVAEFNSIVKQKELEQQELINQRLEEAEALALAFRQHQGEIYNQSVGIFDQWQNITDELATAVEPEAIAELEQNLADLETEIAEGYRRTVLDTLLAEQGWTESITDLAVELGLMTEEAGELQKEYINITTAAEELAKIPGFENLSVEAQALATERLAEGILTASEAFALVDPETWAEGIAPGVARAEEIFRVEPTVEVDDENQDNIDALEEQLERIKEGPWETEVLADVDDAQTDTETFIQTIEDMPKDIEIRFNIVTNGEPPDTTGSSTGTTGDSEAAIGANFTVPGGYYNDNYMLGLSSGEHVTVTPAAGSRASGEGVSIIVQQTFNGNVSAGIVKSAARDGLYESLLKAGIVK